MTGNRRTEFAKYESQLGPIDEAKAFALMTQTFINEAPLGPARQALSAPDALQNIVRSASERFAQCSTPTAQNQHDELTFTMCQHLWDIYGSDFKAEAEVKPKGYVGKFVCWAYQQCFPWLSRERDANVRDRKTQQQLAKYALIRASVLEAVLQELHGRVKIPDQRAA